MSQLAKLFLRGSIKNKIKELSQSEREEIDCIIDDVSKDPSIQPAKIEFCNALRRTISNEYQDTNVAMSEFYIALMKAAIAAKFGYGSKEPNDHILQDPIQKRKWFKNWIFEFLRQILRENKIPSIKNRYKINLPAEQAAINDIINIISESPKYCDQKSKKTLTEEIKNIKITHNKNQYNIYLNHWLLPLNIVDRLQEITQKYLKHNVSISSHLDKITVGVQGMTATMTVEQVQTKPIKHIDIHEKPHDKLSKFNNGQYDFIESDTIRAVRKWLPDDAETILMIIVNPPDDYYELYGTKACKSYISKYMDKKPSEVQRLINIIKWHCLANGVGI